MDITEERRLVAAREHAMRVELGQAAETIFTLAEAGFDPAAINDAIDNFARVAQRVTNSLVEAAPLARGLKTAHATAGVAGALTLLPRVIDVVVRTMTAPRVVASQMEVSS